MIFFFWIVLKIFTLLARGCVNIAEWASWEIDQYENLP